MSNAPWRKLSWEDLGDSRLVPTMLSPEERRAYLWITQTLYQGTGAVVDLGCFAGGSTAALAEGLRRAGHNSSRIQAFDRFRVGEVQKRRFLYHAGVMPFRGDDLFPIAQELLRPWDGLIDLHRTELGSYTWSGGPIEVLVMDASKTTRSMDAMARSLFPSIVPQGGLIIQQDFLHWKTPWIAVQMARLGGAVTPIAYVDPDTVIFRVERAFTADDIESAACDGLDDKTLRAGLRMAGLMLQGFDVGPKLALLDEAVERNPGIRQARQMKASAP